jgi:glucans biosynthesis protein
MHRRDALRAVSTLLASAACAWSPSAVAAPGGDEFFDFAALKGRARGLASVPHVARTRPLPDALRRLDWDHYKAIRFRPSRALWADEDARFRVEFFHPGWHFDEPVRIHEVVDGRAKEIELDAGMFDYLRSGLSVVDLRRNLGFAGFRVLYRNDWKRDVAAFLGASYFRAVGGEAQYGLSARGLAVDCGLSRPEEFPVFTEFWLERPAPKSDTLTLYALLESKSIAGAYRFDIEPRATLAMNVSAALYPRAGIERLGIASLTSMYYQGESDRRAEADWRPQIHDSDGLALSTGGGERIWRPLGNPRNLRFSAYQDRGPKGFGLLQRDRNFDHYQDDGAFYEKRPSAWVEPRSDWGRGSIDLVELPAPGETGDNIVAFWNPARAPQPGEELLFDYRLYIGAPRRPSGRASPRSWRRATASVASSGRSARNSRGASPSTSPADISPRSTRTRRSSR